MVNQLRPVAGDKEASLCTQTTGKAGAVNSVPTPAVHQLRPVAGLETGFAFALTLCSDRRSRLVSFWTVPHCTR